MTDVPQRLRTLSPTAAVVVAGTVALQATVLARTLVVHALVWTEEWEWRQIKNMGVGDPSWTFGGDEETVLAEVDALANECRRRKALLEAVVSERPNTRSGLGHGASGSRGASAFGRVCVVVEGSENYSRKVRWRLSDLVKNGRSVGVHLALIRTPPTAVEMSGAFLALLVGRLLLGGLSLPEAYAVIEDAVGSELSRASEAAGMVSS